MHVFATGSSADWQVVPISERVCWSLPFAPGSMRKSGWSHGKFENQADFDRVHRCRSRNKFKDEALEPGGLTSLSKFEIRPRNGLFLLTYSYGPERIVSTLLVQFAAKILLTGRLLQHPRCVRDRRFGVLQIASQSRVVASSEMDVSRWIEQACCFQ